MSVPMLNAVYSSQVMRGLTAAERVVYQYLVFRYNDATGQCNCPIKTIADQCGFGDGNRRNVARIVNALIRKGYLSRQAFRYRNGEGYCYIPTANPEVATGVKVTPHRGQDNPKQGSTQPPNGGQGSPHKEIERNSTKVSGAATAATLAQGEIAELVGWAAKLLNDNRRKREIWELYITKFGEGKFKQEVEIVRASGLTSRKGETLDARLSYYL